MGHPQVFDTGLTVVHEPEGSNQGRHLVDILFIHGLQGHPYHTWAYNASANQKEDTRAASSSGTSAAPAKRSIAKKLRGLTTHITKTGRDKRDADKRLPSAENPAPKDIGAGKEASSVFWPADLLPKLCPKARILVWGYDTSVSKSLGNAVNKGNIFSQGKDLLFALRRERTVDVPIIFVAHSLGGIVLKEALTGSYDSREADLKNVAKSTKAVMFMGTPHRGSKEMAGVGEIARRVASAFMIDTNSAMLDALGLKNSDLERNQDSFTRIWQDVGFEIKTFQEGMPFAGVNFAFLNEKVVPDFSSLLGDPREHSETLQANHMDMCRFRSEQDPNFRKVGLELKIMYVSVIGTYLPAGSESQQQPEWYKSSDRQANSNDFHYKYQDARSRLYFPEIGKRQHTIETALKDTCQRLLNSDLYETWSKRDKLRENQGLLWIKGKPGSGKSTLMKEALRRARTFQMSRNRHIISFFFNARGSELEQTRIGFFRALLYQLLPVLRHRMQDFIEFCICRTKTDEELAWDPQELKNSLLALFSEPFGAQVFIFVDALDECAGSDGPRETIQFLRELSANAYAVGSELSICMSSRHYPTITIARYHELVVEEFNNSDIALYVNTELSRTIDGEEDDDHWARIKNEIIQRASGIFLWAKLVLEVLLAEYDKGGNMQALETCLSSVPDALGDFYTQILEGISDGEREQTARLFHWVLLAIRPIKIREWYQLLAFIGDNPPKSLAELKLSKDAIDNDEQLLKRIRRMSRGLVEIQRHEVVLQDNVMNDDGDSIQVAPGSFDHDSEAIGVLQFIHESVREFFLRSNGFGCLVSHPSQKGLGHAHLSILKTCFDYLTIQELDSLANGRMKVSYSETSNSTRSSPERSIPSKLPQSVQAVSGSRQVAPDTEPRQGINSFRSQVDTGTGGEFKKPVMRAIQPRRHNSIASRHSFYSSTSNVGSSASNYASSTHSMQSQSDMREPTAERHSETSSAQVPGSTREPNEPSSSTSPPLSSSGHPPLSMSNSEQNSIILQQFLAGSDERDFVSEDILDTSSIDESVQSQGQILDEIPCLLYYTSEMIIPHAISAEKEGCDPSALIQHLQNGESWSRWVSLRDNMSRNTTLLYFAVEHGLLSWAEYLLCAGADVNEWGGKLQRPIIVAIRRKREEMVHLLLRKGADPNASGRKWLRPMHYLAVCADHLFMASILEQYDQSNTWININATDEYDRTPLHMAARWSDRSMLQILVKHGAKLNSLDFRNNTPLHFASNRSDQSLEVLAYLIESGADIQQRNKDGMTPLKLAIRNGFRESARLMIQVGSTTNMFLRQEGGMLIV